MKRAIVTGAYGAIGLAIAEGLLRSGAQVTLFGRELSKLEKAAAHLSGTAPKKNIRTAAVDLGDRNAIEGFVEGWTGGLDLLVNNAATAPPRRQVTSEGIEIQFAVNVLAYFRLISGLAPKMSPGTGARIVNVASYWAGGLDLGDLEFNRRRYDSDAAYRQSKQANRMLSAAFAEELRTMGITVNACHPGDVNSKLSNSLGFGGHETPAQGAATPLWLALSDDVKGTTGKYFEHMQETADPFVKDKAAVDALFKMCASYDTKIK
jgi:NAD(P)-dependent dehydrogenase (short-subunit alcohol dehydrogenase family)